MWTRGSVSNFNKSRIGVFALGCQAVKCRGYVILIYKSPGGKELVTQPLTIFTIVQPVDEKGTAADLPLISRKAVPERCERTILLLQQGARNSRQIGRKAGKVVNKEKRVMNKTKTSMAERLISSRSLVPSPSRHTALIAASSNGSTIFTRMFCSTMLLSRCRIIL